MMRKSYLFWMAAMIISSSACSSPNEPYNPGSGNTGGPTITLNPVIAEFVYKVQQPLTVVLTNHSENATSYQWSFGDGGTSIEKNPTHRYNTKGVYKITLTAKNRNGTQSAYATVTVEEPTKIYITGFTVDKIPYKNQYYRIQVIDDDFFTNTWVKTNYYLLSEANLPFTINLTNRVRLSGIDGDNYYTMQLWYNTKNSGTGTKVAAFKMTKAKILQFPDKLTGTGDNVSISCRFGYE